MRYIALTATALTAAALAAPAQANDTMAELRAGGLAYVSSEHVAMTREDLYLSEAEVRVDYLFTNDGAADESSVIAFPMPDVEGSGDFMVTIPHEGVDNFMDFAATMDGRPVETRLDQHAFAAEVDVTDLLRQAGVPLQPYGAGTGAALNKLPAETLKDWTARGMVINMAYDDGSGTKDDYVPIWKLKTTYWWMATFPAGKTVKVSHRYKPGVGTTAGLSFLDWSAGDKPRIAGPNFERDKARYCLDDSFVKAVAKRLDAAKDGETPLAQSWMSYVLTTGQNWGGTIGTFHLTVDKGEPDALVSFCGDGVKKTGPTTFELTKTDFYPERDLDILILKKPQW